jgi:hypothetical protein
MRIGVWRPRALLAALLIAAPACSEPPQADAETQAESVAPAAEASAPQAAAAPAPEGAAPEPQASLQSVGRGWPLAANIYDTAMVGAGQAFFGPPNPGEDLNHFQGSAGPGETPPGVTPLPIDLFTSTDFYKDKDLWSDPLYWRCNSPTGVEELWAAGAGPMRYPEVLIGSDPPRTAAWGKCDQDYPREAIVSPYPFETAQEHYETLLAETKARGGPTEHTYATVPGEWTGVYRHPGVTPGNETWYGGRRNQVPTILSLLTPEYQQRMVQELYHHGHNNAPQWPSQYCWPEGFMRRWAPPATWEHYILVTPKAVQILSGVVRNFIVNIQVGREFDMSDVPNGGVPRLGAAVPRWYGETIGFWDGDALITWTSNVQGWMAHGMFEHSNKMQSIEIYTPLRDEAGAFQGLEHEAILYDPEALVEPVRIVRKLMKISAINEGAPYDVKDCIQTIFPKDGIATSVSPGEVIQYEVPDMYGRPWAHIWETYFEQGMERPQEEDIFSFE